MEKKKRGPGGVALALVLGGLSLLYLLNTGAGILGEIPDILPFVGNIDEATATAVLISCLAYLGIDLTRIFRRGKDGGEEPREVDGDVIDVDTGE